MRVAKCRPPWGLWIPGSLTQGILTHSETLFPRLPQRFADRVGRGRDPGALPSMTHGQRIQLSCPGDPGKDPGLLGEASWPELGDARGGVENAQSQRKSNWSWRERQRWKLTAAGGGQGVLSYQGHHTHCRAACPWGKAQDQLSKPSSKFRHSGSA